MLLVIDASTEQGVVAFYENGAVVWQKSPDHGYQHSRLIAALIQEGLTTLDIRVEQLRGVVVGVGPGSYTGIRVAAAIGKGISVPHHIPLIGVSTLEGFVPPNEGRFYSVLDARMGGIYLLEGVLKEGTVDWKGIPQVLSIEEFKKMNQLDLVVSPHKNKLAPLFPNEWDWVESGVDPFHLARSGERKLTQGEGSRSGDLELLYLRKTQAEIERSSRGE